MEAWFAYMEVMVGAAAYALPVATMDVIIGTADDMASCKT